MKGQFNELLVIRIGAPQAWHERGQRWLNHPGKPAPSGVDQRNVRRVGARNTAGKNMGKFVLHGLGGDPLQMPALDRRRKPVTTWIAEDEPVEHHIGVEHDRWWWAKGWG